MRFHTKAFTSLFLTITFFALGLSGAVLYVAPRCRVAEQIGWTVIRLQKDQWESLHLNGGLFFVLAAVVHLFLNWSLLWGYIKRKGHAALNLKREVLAAAMVGGLMIAGSVLAWPPFHSTLDLHDQIKDSWGRPYPSGPAMQPENPTVRQLSERVGRATDQVVAALEAEGIVVSDVEATVAQVAEENQRTPEDLRAAIRRRLPEAGPGAGDGRGRGLGGGRGGGGGQGRGMGGGGCAAEE